MPVVAQQATYPGVAWEYADPQTAGWSRASLDSARAYFSSLPPASLVVVDGGKVVVEWGDPAKRIKVSSIRKSFLSALVGIHVSAGQIDLDMSLAQLGIDDEPPLNDTEKTATFRMLLQSRSGVFHPYVGGAPQDRARMPQRGNHPPGTFWYYNNWDFNAAGTAFERRTGAKIGADFLQRVANPIRMQDFRREDSYSFGGTPASQAVEQSVHPAYHFRVSARDLARFGYLFLRNGTWESRQVVPADWVTESTRAVSKTGNDGGYAYLWWVDGWPGVSTHSFSAMGALAKYLIVLPERDLVVVYLNHTEFPDDAAAYPAAEIAKLPTASVTQVAELLTRLLNAQAAVRRRG
jgi:CubicO group peptidase (beta-lactamase class C family)